MSKTVREVPMKFFETFADAEANENFQMRTVEIEDNVTPNNWALEDSYNPAVSILYRLKPFLREGGQGKNKHIELVYLKVGQLDGHYSV